MNILSFILAFTAISSLLFVYYYLFLRKEKQFQVNRFFLLAILPLSFILPQLDLNFWEVEEISPVLETTLQSIDITAEQAIETWAYPYEQWLNVAYMSICFVLLILLILRIDRLFFLIRRSPDKEKISGITLIHSEIAPSISSFGPYIFWNKHLFLSQTEKDKILQHELCHVRQLHSLDVIIMEIWKIMFWFHPLVYLIDREVKMVHEYQADHTASQAEDRHSYIQLLLSQTLGQTLRLSHSFFQHTPKKRIFMMLRKSNTQVARIKYFLLIPFSCSIFFACTININQVPQQSNLATNPNIDPYINTHIVDPSPTFDFHFQTPTGTTRKQPTSDPTPQPDIDPAVIVGMGKDILEPKDIFSDETIDQELESEFEVIPDIQVSKSEPGVKEIVDVSEAPKHINIMEIKKLVGYPKIARDKGIQGNVILRILINKNGRYKKHQIIKQTHPVLVAAVEKHIDKIQFTPAQKDGKAVQYWVNVPFNFKLIGPAKKSNKKKRR